MHLRWRHLLLEGASGRERANSNMLAPGFALDDPTRAVLQLCAGADQVIA